MSRLCATPQMAAHQAPPSLGFSRQEHWSGLPFPSPMHESESEVTQSCPTLHDPMDCSLLGSSFHRIFQARVLAWGAIAFSKGKDIGSEPTALPNLGPGPNHQPPFCFSFLPSPFLLHPSSCFLSFPPVTKSIGQIRPHTSFRLVEWMH